MEFFNKAKVVKLRSHLNKFLFADDDEHTIRQSRNGSSVRARWTVELVEGKSHVIRLKSCSSGKYLTPSNEVFLTGMTGKKVVQDIQATKRDTSVEWEPIKDGGLVKLRAKGGKFLRGNGGAPPWRNSVTHDVPQRTATQDWVLWGVEVVDIAVLESQESFASNLSPMSSFSSLPDIERVKAHGREIPGIPISYHGSPRSSGRQSSGMEILKNAKSVRLKSYHDKYLLADSDGENVSQDRNGTSNEAKWMVEFVPGFNNVVRLKSLCGKYLTASEDQKMMGVSGRKVVQSLPQKLNSLVDWEPIRDGFQIRLKTRYGNYLRANGGLPPWRNMITHDIPSRHLDWLLWDVEVVEARTEDPPSPPPERIDSDLSSSSFGLRTPKSGPSEVDDLLERASVKKEGRMVYYKVADDDGNLDDDAYEEASFSFNGRGVEDLTQYLEEQTGLDDIIVCTRNPLNGKLSPMRLALPPNHKIIHVVVVPSTSKVSREFYTVPT